MPFQYEECFSRNIGLLTSEEQEKLRAACIGIAGCGGVGGSYAIAFARMGVGKFKLADFDSFEPANMNRQFGAFVSTWGQPKVQVLKRMILDINPEAEIELFEKGIQEDTVDHFLEGANIIMDGLDFYALDKRRLLFPACERKGIYIVTSGPLSMTATLHVFGPGAMSFEDYFDLSSCKTEDERLMAFATGVGPAGLHLGQIDLRKLDLGNRKAPSFGSAILMGAALASAEAAMILLGRRPAFLAPRYLQVDLIRHRMKKGYLLWGNRGPIQRIKRRVARYLVEKAARERRNQQ